MPKHTSSVATTEDHHPAAVGDDVDVLWQRVLGRRSFLKGVGLAGAAALPGSALFANQAIARSSSITDGDIAILRFLAAARSEEHTSELQSHVNLVCRLLLEKKN